ncbi:MAG: hypothetical protein KME29_16750 [Calothrix sp. FI2-JRJ7]|nr:hypothetical protein [Calothrix sp. FI2-JRJ7]
MYERSTTCLRKFCCCHQPYRDEFISILQRVNIDSTQTPLLRGTACGVLWSLNAAPTDTTPSRR